MTVKEYIEKNKCGSPYLKYAKNIYSQNGEDGIVEKILAELEISRGTVVEFGAWDGVFLSNVYKLWKHENFNAILIEGDSAKANVFQDRSGKARMFNYFVNPNRDNENSIDNILTKIGYMDEDQTDLVLMSIDVDSCDYYILESMEKYRPMMIIIETSNGFGPEEEFKTYDSGCSMRSVWNLCKIKGYSMVAYTANAILVRNDLLGKLKEYDPLITPATMYIKEDQYLSISSSDENGELGNCPFYLTDTYRRKIKK